MNALQGSLIKTISRKMFLNTLEKEEQKDKNNKPDLKIICNKDLKKNPILSQGKIVSQDISVGLIL